MAHPVAWAGRRLWLALGLTVFGGLLAVSVMQEGRNATEASRGGAGPPSRVTFASGIEARAWFGASVLETGEPVRFYVAIENRSTKPIELRQLLFDSPGLADAGRCWSARSPRCSIGSDVEAIPKTVNANSTVLLWGELATIERGEHSITGSITVADDAGKESIATLSVGPVRVRNRQSALLTLAKGTYAFFKDLGVPVSLALLAYAFQRIQQQRAQAQDTWQAVFPRAHENAVRHMLPFISAVDGFKNQTTAYKTAASPEARETAFRQSRFQLIRLLKIWWDLANEGGGIFFANRDGENVAHACWVWLRSGVAEGLGPDVRWGILDLIGKGETLTSLEKKLSRPRGGWRDDGTPELTMLEQFDERFRKWIDHADIVALEAPVLEFLAAAMSFEIDVLYAEWYSQPDKEPVREALRALTGKIGASTERRDVALMEALKTYERSRLA